MIMFWIVCFGTVSIFTARKGVGKGDDGQYSGDIKNGFIFL
jgi:hypothetical protein